MLKKRLWKLKIEIYLKIKNYKIKNLSDKVIFMCYTYEVINIFILS